MGFSRQEYWSRLPFPSPGIERRSPALQADTLLSEPPGKPGRTDAEAEAPIFWPFDVKSQLTGKDPDAGKD